MQEVIEKLAYQIGEGYQADSLHYSGPVTNAFHRTVSAIQSADLSYINSLVSTGLRGSAFLGGDHLISNYNQLLTSSRQHLPLIIHTNARVTDPGSKFSYPFYDQIHAIQQTGCFQLIANSPEDEVHLTLIAHRIAELSLIPGVVVADYINTGKDGSVPENALIQRYLGSPDDQIPSPTPAQEIIFGKTRRRIPNWFSFELPVLIDSKKDGLEKAYTHAATQQYFYSHLPELIQQAFQEYQAITGIELKPVDEVGKSSNFAIVALGSVVNENFDIESKAFKNVQLININQLNPFPIDLLSSLLRGKKSVTLLEQTSGIDDSYSMVYNSIFKALKDTKAKLYYGKYGSHLDTSLIIEAIQQMVTNQEKSNYFLGIPFTRSSSQYPKHQILLQEIERQYPTIHDQSVVVGQNSIADQPVIQDDIPLAIRRHKDLGPYYTQMARFYDNTALFHKHDKPQELVADPMISVPVLPGSNAGFFSNTPTRELLPVFAPEKCTGCGDCFVYCPHSALPPIVIGVDQLLQTGIELANAKGEPITRLTPMIKNLAKFSATSIKGKEIKTVKDFLPQAFDTLTKQMQLTGEKLDQAQKEFHRVMDEVVTFPFAVTEDFYILPDSIEKGNGALFSVAVDPIACTGCCLCSEVCEENAIVMEKQDVLNLQEAKQNYKLWEAMPDTPGYTITRMLHNQNYSSLAAILLSRNYYMTMGGTSEVEKDNPYKTILHLITATSESAIQPKIIAHLKQIDELIATLSENVHKKLSSALPKDDLGQLSRSLNKTSRRKIQIQDVFSQYDEDAHGKLIDSEELRRKATLVQDLKNLKWVISEGPNGVGRSRYGLILSGKNSLDWAKKYPINHFSSPSVIHWNGSAPQKALGLFHGTLRYVLDHFKLLRRAELETLDKYDPSIHDLSIASLGWDDLTQSEKKLVPPILLVAERDDLDEAGWGSLTKLLAEKYPIKIFLLDHVSTPDLHPVKRIAQTNAGLINSMSLKNAYVFQGGLGNPEHLFDGLINGIDRNSPALFNLYATHYKSHGIEDGDWAPYAELAINSRAFPAITYDPTEKNDFLSGAIQLDGNKDYKENWVTELIGLSNSESLRYTLSWADWAFTQKAWKAHFELIEASSQAIPVPEYLELDVKSRKGKFPIIIRSSTSGLKNYAVSDAVIEMTEATLSHWNTLQELAGILTEFPAKLKEEISKEMSAQFEKEAASLKEKYEQQLKEMEAAQTEIIRKKLKEKLIALSGMAQSKRKN